MPEGHESLYGLHLQICRGFAVVLCLDTCARVPSGPIGGQRGRQVVDPTRPASKRLKLEVKRLKLEVGVCSEAGRAHATNCMRVHDRRMDGHTNMDLNRLSIGATD